MHFFAFASIIDYVLYVVDLFMKKFFAKLEQRLLKYKKRLIYGALALFIGQICFFNFGWNGMQNKVFAQNNNSQTTQNANAIAQEKIVKSFENLSFIKKVVYVLIHPMLIVAGKLVDNSFVYWGAFGFDAVLWRLRNIMRNLANYTLWFIFIYKIFEYLIKKSWNDKIKSLLISSLIAGIWIQASWFIMATLIDLSTILTYWVWWLPITMLKEKSERKYNPYVLKTVVDIDANTLDSYNVYLTNTKGNQQYYISECMTFEYKIGTWSEHLIIAPKMIYYKQKDIKSGETKRIETATGQCHDYGQVYWFSPNGSYIDRDKAYVKSGAQIKWEESQKQYNDTLENEINSLKWTTTTAWWNWGNGSNSGDNQDNNNNNNNQIRTEDRTAEIRGYIKEGKILEIWDAHKTWGVRWYFHEAYTQDQKYWLDDKNEWIWKYWLYWSNGEQVGWETTSRLSDMMDDKSYVGVFWALYSSLMTAWEDSLSNGWGWWIFEQLLNVGLSLWYLLAISIPLIIVAIVFILRVWILWVAIAISPFIALASAFKDIWDKVFEKNWKGFLSNFHISNLIPIIFSPAIICFAISLSTVLITTIRSLNLDEIIKKDTTTDILWWTVQLSLWGLGVSLWKMIVSILWIAITWFLVWAAIETSKIGKSGFVDSLKKLAKNSLWSIPIVPIPTKDWGVDFIWANTAFGLNGHQSAFDTATNSIISKSSQQEQEAVNALFNQDKDKAEAQEKAKATRLQNYIEQVKTAWANWIDTKISTPGDVRGDNPINTSFNHLSSDTDKKSVIDAINALGDEERKKFAWGNSTSIIIWGKTREFKVKDNDGKDLYKYVEEGSGSSNSSSSN